MMSSTMNSCYKDTKLVVILGSTAVGKTKLSIELAKMFDGEIISADSMQVYKGLDIITNKVTPEEKQCIPHHMIDIFDSTQEFTVIDFKQRALKVITDLVKRQKVPIIVGGTNYFIEALLWDFLIEGGLDDVDPKKELRNRKAFLFPGSKRRHGDKNEVDDEESDQRVDNRDVIAETALYDELMKVDPERANQLHPNNLRKISRSLQIYHTTGETHSSLMKKQQDQPGSSKLSGPLRFPKTLLLWLTADQTILNDRISTRVDQMLEKGLENEIKTFYEKHLKANEDSNVETKEPDSDLQIISCVDSSTNVELTEKDSPLETQTNSTKSDLLSKPGKSETSMTGDSKNNVLPESNKGENSVDGVKEYQEKSEDVLLKSYEEGIFQAIGFKEFHKYLTYTGIDESKKQKLLQASLDKLKQITIKYSKKQVRWVMNRIVKRQAVNTLPVYNLNASDIAAWDEHVCKKAKEITQCFMKDEPITHAPMAISDIDEKVTVTDKHRKHVCDDCNGRIIIGDDAWEIHLKSKRHRKMKVNRAKKMQVSAQT
ncbi:tRNA dimethylallyltransferase-like isoform X2 [Clytia hemisphaerica]